MKKSIFCLLLFVTLFGTANAQLRIGVKAGANATAFRNGEIAMLLPDLDIKKNGYSTGLDLGYHFGVELQYMFSKHIGISSGLSYYACSVTNNISLDSSVGEHNFSTYYNVLAKPNYLVLPVNFLYKFNLSSKTNLYPSLGVYLGYGLSGKTKIKVPSIEEGGIEIGSFTIEEDIFSKKTGFQRFDAGAGAGINLDIDHFYFGISGKFGFVNARKETKEQKNIHGIVFLAVYEATLGYFF
jgi:hypothetical protein